MNETRYPWPVRIVAGTLVVLVYCYRVKEVATAVATNLTLGVVDAGSELLANAISVALPRDQNPA